MIIPPLEDPTENTKRFIISGDKLMFVGVFFRKDADIELGGGSFLIHRNYKDDVMARLLNVAAKVLGER